MSFLSRLLIDDSQPLDHKHQLLPKYVQLVVSTLLKNIGPIGNILQIGMRIANYFKQKHPEDHSQGHVFKNCLKLTTSKPQLLRRIYQRSTLYVCMYVCMYIYIYHRPSKPITCLEVFMVNNLIFRWPKPLSFVVLGTHGAYMCKLMTTDSAQHHLDSLERVGNTLKGELTDPYCIHTWYVST